MTDSARALSYESPTDPIEGSIPAAASRSVYRIDRYWVGSTGGRNTSSVRSCDGREETSTG